MPPQRDPAHLVDLLHAARHLEAYTRGFTLSQVASNSEKLSAVLYQIAVMGEAVRRLSTEYRAAHPNLPWSDIAGIRSVVIHEYDRVSLDKIWEVVQRDLPVLTPQPLTLLKEFGYEEHE
jgi:uncharacterized protein with HEPN domain